MKTIETDEHTTWAARAARNSNWSGDVYFCLSNRFNWAILNWDDDNTEQLTSRFASGLLRLFTFYFFERFLARFIDCANFLAESVFMCTFADDDRTERPRATDSNVTCLDQNSRPLMLSRATAGRGRRCCHSQRD